MHSITSTSSFSATLERWPPSTRPGARRATIFNELQALACSIGVFQPPPDVAAIQHQNDTQSYFPAVGDWRQATANLNYQDEFEYHLNGKPQH